MLSLAKQTVLSGNWYQNHIMNGNYENGINLWNGVNAAISVSNGVLSVVGNGGSTLPLASNVSSPCVINNKYYVISELRVTNSVAQDIRLCIDGTTGGTEQISAINNPIQNIWYLISAILTSQADFTGTLDLKIRHGYIDKPTSNGKILEIKRVGLLNLTSVFGVGKEPSKEWCNINIAPYIKY